MNDREDGRHLRPGLWAAALVAATLLEATTVQAQERRPGGIVFAIGAEETFYRLPMTSYVLDTNIGVFASTQQYSNSISPKASLSYAFEDPAKFGGFGTNARISASLTRDYASSVASLTTGQLTGNVALINGTIQPGGGFVPSTWTSTQTYEEWRARIDLQTDFIVGGNAAVSPRLGVTFSSANTAYNLSRIASGINNGNPYTMINASLYGFYLGAAFQIQDDLLNLLGSEREFLRFVFNLQKTAGKVFSVSLRRGNVASDNLRRASPLWNLALFDLSHHANSLIG